MAQSCFAYTQLTLQPPQCSSEMTPPSGTRVSDTSESLPLRTFAITLTILHRFSKTSPILLQRRSAPHACKANRRSFLILLPPPFRQLKSSSLYVATSVAQCKWLPSRVTIILLPLLTITLDGLLSIPFQKKHPSPSRLLSKTTSCELNVFTESTSRRFVRTAEPTFRAI